MLADTRPEHVRLLTGPGRTTTVSGSLPPDAQHAHFRAQDAEHALSTYRPTHFGRLSSLRSSKTLTPATRPPCSGPRPTSQQGLLWRGRLHSSHSPGPTSGNSGFPTKISLCPTPPLPGSHHSSASNSDLPSGAGDVQPRNCVTSHRQGSLCRICVLKRTKDL